jgi:hypothetical protein
MFVSAWIALVVTASGCSFMVQPKRSLDPRAPQPSAEPVVIDTMLAVTAGAMGIVGEAQSCSSCFINAAPVLSGVALAAAAAFTMSALYGYSRNADAPVDTAGTRSSDLAIHVSIAAHGGDCATAARDSAKLHATDRRAWEGLLSDELVQTCLLNASDAERRVVLDAIAHSPNAIPLASSR